MGEHVMEERPNVVVAVTGHRRIDPVLIPDLRLRVAGVLDGLCLRAGGAPRLCMLNALAVGADSLVFDIAVGKGIPVDAVLPLPPEEYEKDFAPGADGDGFRRRLGKARRVWVPETVLPRPDCYAALGAVLVRHADVLLAIWDGQPSCADNGGTAHVVNIALGPAVMGSGACRPDVSRRKEKSIEVVHVPVFGVNGRMATEKRSAFKKGRPT